MLYPSELSRGGRTGFEPAADGFRRCSATELPSSRNTFSRPRAYATAAPRAPDGRTSPYRWKPFERCFALASRTRHQSCCAIASACRPCPASGHSACAPHGRFPSQAFHARMLGMRIDHANTLAAPFANAQKKTPPDMESEGVRVPRRSGRPIPARESVAWNEAVQPCVTATQRAAARIAIFARWHGVGGDVEEAFHRRNAICVVADVGEVAHLTRRLRVVQVQSRRTVENRACA